MSTSVLIIGESGTGKSTAIRTLDPKETYIINVLNKPLPFRGWKKIYKVDHEQRENTNYCVPNNHAKINAIMKVISEERPHIKNIIIDDFQYIMCNEFMYRINEKGYDKWNEIAEHVWRIFLNAQQYRENLTIFALSHSERGEDGKFRAKTIGKLLNEKVTIEGMFTIVLHSIVADGSYLFKTNGDETTIAKSPLGMFNEQFIPNDLKYVVNTINQYNEGE